MDDNKSAFERRVDADNAAHVRAEELLSARGRFPGVYTHDEYVEALDVAQSEAEAEAERKRPPDLEALRAKPDCREVVDLRVQTTLAEEGKTLDDVTTADEYLRRYALAEAELYPEVLR